MRNCLYPPGGGANTVRARKPLRVEEDASVGRCWLAEKLVSTSILQPITGLQWCHPGLTMGHTLESAVCKTYVRLTGFLPPQNGIGLIAALGVEQIQVDSQLVRRGSDLCRRNGKATKSQLGSQFLCCNSFVQKVIPLSLGLFQLDLI